MVQRTLASKNLSHAKAGCTFASYLKVLPLWLIIFPGMIARILYPERVACSDPEQCLQVCGSPRGCANIAYIELVIKLLPSGKLQPATRKNIYLECLNFNYVP